MVSRGGIIAVKALQSAAVSNGNNNAYLHQSAKYDRYNKAERWTIILHTWRRSGNFYDSGPCWVGQTAWLANTSADSLVPSGFETTSRGGFVFLRRPSGHRSLFGTHHACEQVDGHTLTSPLNQSLGAPWGALFLR